MSQVLNVAIDLFKFLECRPTDTETLQKSVLASPKFHANRIVKNLFQLTCKASGHSQSVCFVLYVDPFIMFGASQMGESLFGVVFT